MTSTPTAGGTRRGERAPGLLAALAGAVAVAVAGGAFVASFTPARTALLVAAGVVAGLVGGWVLGSSSLPRTVRLLVAVACGVLGIAAGAGSVVPATLVDGVVDGPRRLLTGPVPADADVLARVPPVVVCWAAATLAVVLARRGRRGAVVLLAGGTFLVATATGLSTGPARAGLALGLLAAVLLVGVVVRSPIPSAAGPAMPRRRPRPLGAAVLVALAMVAGVLGARAADDPGEEDRATLRSLFEEEPVPTEVVNPLDVAAAALTGADAGLGQVEVEPPGQPRLPVATFEDFDGDTFLFGTDLVPAGARIDVAQGDGLRSQQTLDLERWPFDALPHDGPAAEVDAPRRVRADLGVDVDTGRLVTTGGEGRWRITSTPSPPQVPGEALLVPGTDLPPLPPMRAGEFRTIEEEARTELDALGPTFALAEVLAARFRTSFRTVAPGTPAAEQRGGHGTLVLGCLVNAGFAGDASQCADRAGSRTQVAAAYVVLLRRLGLAARLAVGFDLAPTSGPQELRTHGLTAWAEVDVEGVGWVAVDPVPDDAGEAGEAPSGGSGSTTETDTGVDPTTPDPKAVVEEVGRDPRSRTAALVATGLLVLAAVGAAPAVVRRRRQRRRRAGPPAAAVVGAWWEMRDRLRERGEETPASATVSDVVERHGGGDPGVAGLVNAVGFGLRDATDAEAARCWEAVAAGESAWRGRATRRRRAARYLRCGPVLRRRRRRDPGPAR